MLCEMAGTKHQILNHCPQSPAMNFPLRRLLVLERFLANHPQQIEGNHRKFQNQRIGSKLPGRQAFNIHVGFQFAVILFAFPMRMLVHRIIINWHNLHWT